MGLEPCHSILGVGVHPGISLKQQLKFVVPAARSWQSNALPSIPEKTQRVSILPRPLPLREWYAAELLWETFNAFNQCTFFCPNATCAPQEWAQRAPSLRRSAGGDASGAAIEVLMDAGAAVRYRGRFPSTRPHL